MAASPHAALLKAFLLWVACERPSEVNPTELADWYVCVTSSVWKRLGFESRPPLLTLQLAFSLIDQREHQAPELRALIMAVTFFASADLLPAVRS